MIRKHTTCVCGWQGRLDKLKPHIQHCTAKPIIEEMQAEMNRLREEVAYLKSHPNGTTMNHSNNTTNNYTTNNITNHIHITVYGEEKIPKALSEIQRLCRQQKFEDCVPHYLEMKHFPEGEEGNVKVDGDSLVVVERDSRGEKQEYRKDKDREIERMTEKGGDEIIEHYGDKPIACMYENWHEKNNMNNTNSKEFKSVKRKVEQMLNKNSSS
tara:strand:+ start:82 stop:717 length:636 start_codon:yes stop_codon:yes gene_type:complete